jgi:hypothetical protein
VAITGSKGRVELYERHHAHVIERDPTGVGRRETRAGSDSEGSGADARADPAQSIRLFPMFSAPVDVAIPPSGPHAGDALMLEQIFDPGAPPDPDGRAATQLDGAAAVLLGTAANRSIATGMPVGLDQLHATL